MSEPDPWDRTEPGDREHRRRLRRSHLRGLVVGLAVVAVLLFFLLVGRSTWETSGEAGEEDLCLEAAHYHMQQAEAAESPADREAHAELAFTYQVEASNHRDCTWWSPEAA